MCHPFEGVKRIKYIWLACHFPPIKPENTKTIYITNCWQISRLKHHCQIAYFALEFLIVGKIEMFDWAYKNYPEMVEYYGGDFLQHMKAAAVKFRLDMLPYTSKHELMHQIKLEMLVSCEDPPYKIPEKYKKYKEIWEICDRYSETICSINMMLRKSIMWAFGRLNIYDFGY